MHNPSGNRRSDAGVDAVLSVGPAARAWDATGARAGHRALILGAAGIGKTRLAEEVAVVVRGRGGRVVGVKGREGEARLRWG